MSPCCLSVRAPPPAEILKGARGREDSGGFGEALLLRARHAGVAAAWSPNPEKPPLYLDLPVDRTASRSLTCSAKWAANSPLAFADQYIGDLRRYSGIAIDVGDQDGLRTDTSQTTGDAASLRHREHIRRIQRHSHQRRGGAFPELRDAVLQQAPGLRMKRLCRSQAAVRRNPPNEYRCTPSKRSGWWRRPAVRSSNRISGSRSDNSLTREPDLAVNARIDGPTPQRLAS